VALRPRFFRVCLYRDGWLWVSYRAVRGLSSDQPRGSVRVSSGHGYARANQEPAGGVKGWLRAT
jgi:hypothetical protein